MLRRADSFVNSVSHNPLKSIEWVVCITTILSAIVNFITKATDNDIDNLIETETAIHALFGAVTVPIVLQLFALIKPDRPWSRPFRKAGLLCTSIGYVFLSVIRIQVFGVASSIWLIDFSRALVAAILYLSLRWND